MLLSPRRLQSRCFTLRECCVCVEKLADRKDPQSASEGKDLPYYGINPTFTFCDLIKTVEWEFFPDANITWCVNTDGNTGEIASHTPRWSRRCYPQQEASPLLPTLLSTVLPSFRAFTNIAYLNIRLKAQTAQLDVCTFFLMSWRFRWFMQRAETAGRLSQTCIVFKTPAKKKKDQAGCFRINNSDSYYHHQPVDEASFHKNNLAFSLSGAFLLSTPETLSR